MSVTLKANGTARKSSGPAFTTDPVSGDMIFETPADFQAYSTQKAADYDASGAKKSGGKGRPCLFLYKNYVYDATEFADAHPGGAEILEQYNGKDITMTFHDEYNHHAHTKSALNMMLQYRVGRVLRSNAVKLNGSSTSQQLEEYELYKLEELTAYPKMTDTELIYRDFTIRRDRGLIWQSMFLSLDQYYHLIETPIYSPGCKLFDTAFLEPFSKTKYWVVAVLWLPLSFFWAMRALFKDYSQSSPSMLNRYLYIPNNNWFFHNYPYATEAGINGTTVDMAALAESQLQHARDISKFGLSKVAFVFACGLVLWTLTEYSLHRFIFHFERLLPRVFIDNPLGKLLHMVLHGIHHIIPMDPDRLVFPPALFVVMCSFVYQTCALFMAGSLLDLVASALVAGYVCYDQIHYLIHHVEPTDFYFKDLKRYHHAHHYVDDSRGYGISNKFWDFVFSTECRKS